MRNKKPPFEITNTLLDKIAEITALADHVNAALGLSETPAPWRTNRIRTIYSSLAIEQNTLSLDQVTAVLDGKHVIAPSEDIAKVKNSYEIYETFRCTQVYRINLRRKHIKHRISYEIRCFSFPVPRHSLLSGIAIAKIILRCYATAKESQSKEVFPKWHQRNFGQTTNGSSWEAAF